MKDPETELGTYRQQIYLDDVLLLNTRLRLLKEFNDANNRLVWEASLSGTSSVFYKSLFDNLIVTLSWIYSESTQDKRSLTWYLDQVKANSSKFSADEIDQQLQKIHEIKHIVEKIRRVRDKWIAHRDPVAFNDPIVLLNKHEVTVEDFDTLVKLAEDLIEEHFERFEGVTPEYEIAGPGIDALTSCVKARNDLLPFLEEMDLSTGKPDSEERKNRAIRALLEKQNK